MPEVKKQTPKTAKKTGSVLDRIGDIGFDGDDGIKMLMYGRSGSGKTTTWATFPPPILSVIVSGGNKPGELRSIDTPEYKKKIKQVALERSEELGEVIAHVAESGKYQTLVLDHVTGLQDLVLKEILGVDELPAQKGWGMASQQQYGQCTLMCKEYLRNMLGLSCNVVVIAQEREFNTDSDSELLTPFVGAALSPSLTGWLNTAVDYIVQTFIRQKEKVTEQTINGKSVPMKLKVKGVDYCLRTAPDPIYTTKFRLPRGVVLPEYLVDATYDKILKLIKGGK